MVVIDWATDAFGGDENSRREVRRYLRMTRRHLARYGACVVHILHVDKRAARGGATGDHYSGVTDWNNGVRARLALYRPRAAGDDSDGTDDDAEDADAPLRLELQKSNYSARVVFVELRYDPERHLFVRVDEPSASTGIIASITLRRDENAILRALATAEDAGEPVHSAEQAKRNASIRLDAAGVLPSAFRGKAGKRRLFKLLLKLKVGCWPSKRSTRRRATE